MTVDGNDAEPISDALLNEVRSYDTATLFEAAGQVGAMNSEIRPIDSGYRLAGPALTVACPPGDNLMIHAAMAEARPGEVLVVQCHDAGYGVWGEVLMTSAMALGIAGLVIDGSVRDVPALRKARIPVFCRAISIRGAGKTRRGLLRQPVSCGGEIVWPGDIVIADDSGIVVIARSALAQVLANARQRQAKEATIMEALRGKQTTLDLLDLRKAVMHAKSPS